MGKIPRSVLLSVLFFSTAGALSPAVSGEQPMGATVLAPEKMIRDFALTDHRGNPFTRESLTGAWTLVFFGFSHCPHICPSSLALLKSARQWLPEEVRVLFVSVDPMRDTPEVLAAYIDRFGDGFTAVTAPMEQLLPVFEDFGIHYAFRADGRGGYDVDHSTAVYALDPHARLAAVITSPTRPREVADFLSGVIQ